MRSRSGHSPGGLAAILVILCAGSHAAHARLPDTNEFYAIRTGSCGCSDYQVMREVITTPPGPARDELTDTRVSQNLCFRIPPDTHWQKISGEGLIVLMRLVPPQEGLAPLYFKAADIIPPKPETAPAGTPPAIAEPDAYPSPESSSPAPALPGETPQSPDTSETAAPSLPEWTGYALAAIVALALLLAAPRLHLIAELIRVRPAFALIAFTLTAAAAIWLH